MRDFLFPPGFCYFTSSLVYNSMKQLLFSYGTLQLESVQMDNFGRRLGGTKDRLNGYRLDAVEIKDEDVLKSSGLVSHPIARVSDNPGDYIEGTVYELSEQELLDADRYEVEDYKRIEVELASGLKSWVYVSV
jgi:gamma-glutamylcyclotransferase (GGCT)/AIG2-like uncharacterized protein YtfP